MRISRVLIQNYRNFRKLEINPFPASAVIVGENGVGKSNLLRALRIVLDPDLPESARMLRSEDICDYAEVGLAEGVEVRIEVDLTDFEGNRKAEAALDGCFVSLDPLTARITYFFHPLRGIGEETKASGLTRDDYTWEVGGGPEGKRDAKYLRRDVPFTVLPALRDAVGDLSRWRDSPLQELLEVRPPSRDSLELAAQRISDAMDELAKAPELSEVSKDLSQRLQLMAGNRLSIEPNFGFASSDADRLLRAIRMFVDSARIRSVADTSTGAANVIYLALLLERLSGRQKTDSILQSILAVEEPEAHLHPVLQRQVFRYLLKHEPALIVSTHSPNIAAVSRLESLVLLRPGSDGSTVASYTSRIELEERQHQDLERYLDVSRAEILFCSAAILVEGTAEVYVIPALAKSLGFDLDFHGVIVGNISGTDFKPFRTLLGESALAVPHVIVTDGDPTSKKGDYIHLGLRRAAKLIPAPRKAEFDMRIESLISAKDTASSAPLRLEAAEADVFIGPKTLEVDVAGLLHKEMVLAHTELEESTKLRVKFDEAVYALRSGSEESEVQDELLRRVNHVSKGRFAQRLAAHVEEADLASTLVSLISKVHEEAMDAKSESAEERVQRALINYAPYGYLLAALDRVSILVRGHGLFSEFSGVANV
ncbi:AAA family ATPase [Streptacidiphilus sp. ASG 303]|uniref:ATP-dependent nuclease n=1 Tax=Streptacidiphilus sp. ASG 303 TaxID=2896847 RepID=UPI001E46D544|nr:AAA family ATPase [Streptacidiphilus sp. ASG 303]MCD0483436.1 AAA family ATPase [Streptacidiphilus sp. ASG 303]